MAGEAVYEVVLAAVLLIGDEDDVAPGGTFDWEPASLGDDDRDPEAIVRGVAAGGRRLAERGVWLGEDEDEDEAGSDTPHPL